VTGPGLEPGTTGLKERTLGVGKALEIADLQHAADSLRTETRTSAYPGTGDAFAVILRRLADLRAEERAALMAVLSAMDPPK